VQSPDRSRTAILRGYQPRGTISGYVTLTFSGPGADRTSTFLRMRNATIGWVAPDALALIADHLEYSSVASHHYPDGTIRTETRLIPCVRGELDCSKLEAAMGTKKARIGQFPEG
jgi:hypothetical protein